MLVTNGNEQFTVPAEAGRGLLCEMGRILNGTCLVSASPVFPADHPLWVSFTCWGSGLLPLLPISVTFLCRPVALKVVEREFALSL